MTRLEEIDELFGNMPDRWEGITEKTRKRIYKIAHTPREKDIEPMVNETMKEVRGEIPGLNYSDSIRAKISIELDAAISAHYNSEENGTERYGPFNDQNYASQAA